MSFRGIVVNGRVELLDGAVIPEGTIVRVVPVKGKQRKTAAPKRGGGLARLADHAVKTGITDLADEHDHYIYGVPKRRTAKPTAKKVSKAKTRRRAR